MKRLWILLVISIFGLSTTSVNAQIFKKKKDKKEAVKPAAKKPKKKPAKIKKFEDVITKEAISSEGLWNTHKVEDKNYFEISKEVLDREILVVSRIAGFVKNLNFGGAGVKSRPQQVIRWQKMDGKILLRSVSYNSVADENLPIYESVKNNNFEPIIMAFDIKAHSKDSSGFVFEVDELFTTDVPLLGATFPSQDKRFGLRGVDKRRSFVKSTKAFPTNVEVRHVLTYKGSDKQPDNRLSKTLSLEMNQSFIVLPDDPWQKRKYDPRVGYFSLRQTDYGSEEQKTLTNRYITRWRLDPEDPAAYARGELVKPKKQIVYYIDPATPKKWIPFLKQGVEDWQSAFETAGFKEAIIAKEAPTKEEDPDWSAEDARYSVIRYITTEIQNAQGPHVHDPRTGEILESDIMWYHNIMNLLRNWHFVQTAAINPDARGVRVSDDIMGELIRFVAAHEVGHTLGLPHNMGSSVGYPVDSLRSKTFTDQHGTAPSIMDYARFNYIAQPGDGVTQLYPQIGEYDDWSIEFGYRLIPGVTDADEEKRELNDWIKAKEGNPVYRYGRQRGLPLDHTAQTEDLGDDSMEASEYGLKNLKRIVPKLQEWSYEDATQYTEMRELYNSVVGQFNRYVGHVVSNIGGVKEDYKTFDQGGPVYVPNPKDKQKRAIAFLDDHVFKTPEWLVDPALLERLEPNGNLDRIKRIHSRAIRILFDAGRLKRMTDNEAINDTLAYSTMELFNDINDIIFAELDNGSDVTPYRRNLHRALINRYFDLLEDEESMSDYHAQVRSSLKSIQKRAANKLGNSMTAIHFQDISDRIESFWDRD